MKILLWLCALVLSPEYHEVAARFKPKDFVPGSTWEYDNSEAKPGKDHREARLLVRQRIHNKELVESLDMVVEYNIYNIGSRAAVDVQLRDVALAKDQDFKRVSGFLHAKLGRIPPDESVSHTVVVRPRKTGRYNFTAAQVSYYPRENADELTYGYSNELGQMVIHSQAEYYKLHSAHFDAWFGFILMSFPTLVVPFLLWVSSNNKYGMYATGKLRSYTKKGR